MKTTIIGFLTLALGLASVTPASSDVIPRGTLYRILDATPQLKRSKPVIAISDWRFYKVAGSDAAGFIMPEFNDYGFVENGQDLLIVPMGSGGSGGVFFALLFTGINSEKPRFIGYLPSAGGHLEAYISGGNLIVTTPNYKANDPNCCPSSETETTYAIKGITMTKTESRTVR